MSLRIDGKIDIVTGRLSGIGAAIARRMVEEGAKVISADLSSGKTSLFALRSSLFALRSSLFALRSSLFALRRSRELTHLCSPKVDHPRNAI